MSVKERMGQRSEMTNISILTHFMPLASFYTHLKYQKTRGFLIFSGSIGRDQWHEMD